MKKKAAGKFKESLESLIEKYCDRPVSYTVRTGKSWQEIVRAAEKWGADLIVVYHNRHREINEVFSRSCSQRVADHAGCSVLRVRNLQSLG